MKFWKKPVMFTIGGLGYVSMELLWRGWSHYSMFLAGGSCFLLLGRLNQTEPRLPQPARTVAGAGIITGVELAAGLLFNRGYQIWDYRSMPLNYHGQICVPYFLLWLPVGAGAMALYERLDRGLSAKP